MQNEQAFQFYKSALWLVKNVHCYAASNDILITWIHIAMKVSHTRPDNGICIELKKWKWNILLILVDWSETKLFSMC